MAIQASVDWISLGSLTSLSIEGEAVWVDLGLLTGLYITPSEVGGWVDLGEVTGLHITSSEVGGWVDLGVLTNLSIKSGGGVTPPVCTPGETKCIGPDLYECSPDSEWVLIEENSTQCAVEEEGAFPWLWVAGGLGALALIAAAMPEKKKGKVKAKP
jgi:MYXO-CTERM domain-containing protein